MVQIDTARIPRVSRLHYDNASHVVSFTAPRYPLYLVARIEAATTNSSWQLVKSVPLKKKPYEFRLPKNIQFKNLRLIHLTFSTSVYSIQGVSIILRYCCTTGCRCVWRRTPACAGRPPRPAACWGWGSSRRQTSCPPGEHHHMDIVRLTALLAAAPGLSPAPATRWAGSSGWWAWWWARCSSPSWSPSPSWSSAAGAPPPAGGGRS